MIDPITKHYTVGFLLVDINIKLLIHTNTADSFCPSPQNDN